jgi:high frequency lysogenization protein
MAAIDNRTIALAGLYQSVDLVMQIAWSGQADEAPFKASLASIFKLDANSYEAVFGGLNGIKAGLHVLRAQLTGNKKERQLERTRYVVTLLHLEKKLKRDSASQGAIQEGIARARGQLTHFDPMHINVVSRLADTYQSSISKLRPKVIVRGEPSYLANPNNARRIRALLLAGIRAAVLWRQAGGNRWLLILSRNRLLHDVETSLSEV